MCTVHRLQKTCFCLSSACSVCDIRGERGSGFNQREGQPPLIIHSTSRSEQGAGGVGGWESAPWFQLQFVQGRKKATSIWQQPVQAVFADRSTLLLHGGMGCLAHIIHTIIIIKEKGWASHQRRRHQANGAHIRAEQTRASGCLHKHGNPEMWPHTAACEQSTHLMTLH